MRRAIAGVGAWVWLGCFSVATAQLPPEVLVDQYLLRADRLMEGKETKAALDMMSKIVAIRQAHDLTLPDEFHFKYAKVAFSAGLLQNAKESVNRYLMVAGRESEFYREALNLSIEIGELQGEKPSCTGKPKGSECWMELANPSRSYVWTSDYQPYQTVIWTGGYVGNVAHGKGTLKRIWKLDQQLPHASLSRLDGAKCTSQSKGSSCWTELTGQEGCYVWSTNPQPNQTVTWTADCSGGRAQGKGILTWVSDRSEKTREGRGDLQHGKMHGQWIWFNQDGSKRDSFYVDGERVGRTAEDEYVMKGRLVKGRLHGHWVQRYGDGNVTEGPYVSGKRHGDWVWRDKDGRITREGSYANGKRHGGWVERFTNGDVNLGPYWEDRRHGNWIIRWANGTIEGVYYEHGRERNSWFHRDANGTTYDGHVVAGKRFGKWTIKTKNGMLLGEGPYAEGKKHGFWTEFYFKTKNRKLYIEGSYADGLRQGRWNIYRFLDRKKRVRGGGFYIDGEKIGSWVEFRHNDGRKTKIRYGGNK